ncbi:MAG TPA: DUF222 domain-containing protein [Acidimicrobiia bacterium]|nr:DUF222 domain-containing protein [Acidimicrobiia bacterium]
MEPSPVLAAFLSTLTDESLSGFDRIRVMQAHQRLASHFQARVLEDVASISDLMNQIDVDPEVAHDSAAAEIGAALHLTRRAADSDLALAIDLKERLPEVWEALAAGRIDLRRARVIVHGTAHLSETATREVVDRILEAATRLTTGQLGALIRKVCVQADPDDAAVRFREALEERRLETEPTVNGTAHLFGLDLPPDRAQAAMRRITDIAQSLKTSDETRTLDQIRADVFLDLLDGKHLARSGGRRGTVDIHVDLTTLARLSDDPGELAGYGPVIADIARQVAENQPQAEWRWTLTHPDTGLVVDNGLTRRRPTARQRRQVEARNRTCVFPGCRMPAVECDLDHRQPWAHGGPTKVRNLAPLCRHHHNIRHHSGWTHQASPNGDHLWTSRLGHTYTTSGLPP